MNYFDPLNYQCRLLLRKDLPLINVRSTYFGKNLTSELRGFYIECFGLINNPQVQESDPNFRRFDFVLKPSLKRALNYFLRTQIKCKGTVHAHDSADRLFEAFTPVWKTLQDNQRLFSAALFWRKFTFLSITGKEGMDTRSIKVLSFPSGDYPSYWLEIMMRDLC